MSTLPPLEQVLALPAQYDQAVTEDFIDANGHMNIGDYFRLGTMAPWLRMMELGVDADYIERRKLSFFTVEHHIRYAAELRLGQRFSVHTGLVERTGKALRAAAFVVDREHDQVACVLELVYVHVDMTTRRSAPIPDDIAAALDTEIARTAGAELAQHVDRMPLRR